MNNRLRELRDARGWSQGELAERLEVSRNSVNAIENGKPSALPRAYRLPYAKDLHAMLNEGMKKSRQGVSQMGTAEPKRGPRGLSWLRPGSDEQEVKIRDLPSPQLPEK